MNGPRNPTTDVPVTAPLTGFMFDCQCTWVEPGLRNWNAKSLAPRPSAFQLIVAESDPTGGVGMSAGVAIGTAVPCAYACEPAANAAAPARPDNNFASRRRDAMNIKLPSSPGNETNKRTDRDRSVPLEGEPRPRCPVTPFVNEFLY